MARAGTLPENAYFEDLTPIVGNATRKGTQNAEGHSSRYGRAVTFKKNMSVKYIFFNLNTYCLY